MALYKPAQGFAQGLLSLLHLKTNGNNPDELSSVLSPIIEMREWMLLREMQMLSFSALATVSVGGGTVQFQEWDDPDDPNDPDPRAVIPQDEVWYVWSYSLFFVKKTTYTINGGLIGSSLVPPGNAIDILGQTEGYWGNGNSNVIPVKMSIERRFYPPGTIFGWGHGQIDESDDEMPITGYMGVTKLKI